MNYTILLTDEKKYPYKLSFPMFINRKLRSKLKYAHVVFKYKTEKEANEDGAKVLSDLARVTGESY